MDNNGNPLAQLIDNRGLWKSTNISLPGGELTHHPEKRNIEHDWQSNIILD